LVSDPRPGRFCPPSYRYSPASLARPPEIYADTLYVVGGLYGNVPALDVVERLAATESGVTRVVFNGDFHWFDADPSTYAEIDRRVTTHIALRGNVETELASEDAAVGCGCAYPDSVSDADVARSNDILARLRETARGDSMRRTALAALPMNAVAEIGGARIAIVHGDPESLAGWGFAHDRLEDPHHHERLAAWCEAAQVDAFASSHTCLPACRALHGRGRQTVVINNGAAGMPNFAGTVFGIATRISTRVAPPGLALYGVRVGALNVDAVRLDYDHDAWVHRFLAMWPAGSPAHRSYFQRIVTGPAYARSQAEPAVIQLETERLARAGRV
jgi:hypothetical protein